MTWLSQILSKRVRGGAITENPFNELALASAGRRRLGCRSRACPGALGDARRLTRAAAQIIEFRSSDHAATHHLDRGDPGRIEREDTLHALAIRDLAQGKVRVD